MAGNTVLVGVGMGDEERIPEFADTIRKLVDGGGGRAILTHVFAEEDERQLEDVLDIDAREPTGVDSAVGSLTVVRELSASLSDDGIDPEYRGKIGRPSESLLEIASAEEADFVVVGGRKRSPAGKAVFGSTAQQVLLGAKMPVVLVKADTDE